MRRRRRRRPASGRDAPVTAILTPPLLIVLTACLALAGPGLRSSLQRALANPNLCLPLLLAGIFLLYLEFNRPGAVLPAALGSLCATLALFGLAQLPLSPVALLAIALALTLLALELLLPLHFVAAALSAAALAFGLARLVRSPAAMPATPLAVHPAVALLTAFLFVGITLALARIALRARRQKLPPARIQLVTAHPPPPHHGGVN